MNEYDEIAAADPNVRLITNLLVEKARQAACIAELGEENKRLHERLEDKTTSIRVEIAAKLAAYNEIKELEAERVAALARIGKLEKTLEPFVAHADRYADWLRKAIAPNPSNEAFDAARSALAEAQTQ